MWVCAVDSLLEMRADARKMRKSGFDVNTMRLLLGNKNAGKWRLQSDIWRAELDAILQEKIETDEPGEDWRGWFDSKTDILNAPPVSHMIQSIILLNRYNGVVSLPGARKTILCWNVVRACLTGKPLLERFAVANPPERVIFLAAESARNEIKQRLTDMELTPFLESGKLLIRSAFMDTPFHADRIPDHLAKNALIIFDTFVRFFDGGDEQSALEARKFTEQMRRLVNLGATVLVMFHAPKGATAETLDLQAIRGSGELGAGLVHAFSLSMQGPTWHDNTLMRQVKNREHQCEPHTFEFTCDVDTAVCTFVGEASVFIGRNRNNKDAKTQADDAVARKFIADHPGLTAREYTGQCLVETGVHRSERTFRRWLAKGCILSE